MLTELIGYKGLTFRCELQPDDDSTPPWEREDGHGPVSEWRAHGDDSRGASKRPGERELCDDGRSFGRTRFYDMREAMRIAKRDGWGLSDEDKAKLAAKLGRDLKPGDIAAAAVEADFQRLRTWCADLWSYVGVVVTLLDTDGEPTDERESLWGIESDCEDYLNETARELAQDIARRMRTRKSLPGQRIRA
jgi:hypothetical protein